MSRAAIRPLVVISLVTLMLVPLSFADGSAAYKSKCAMCHGEDGAGATTMGKKLGLKNLASPEIQKQDDAALTALIAKGKGKMPAFGSTLSETEIKEVVAHVRKFAKK